MVQQDKAPYINWYRTPVQFENELKMDKNVVNEIEVKSTSFCVEDIDLISNKIHKPSS